MESTHWFDDLIEEELALALMIYWQLAPPYLVVDALDLAHTSTYMLMPLSPHRGVITRVGSILARFAVLGLEWGCFA